jgi:hypothetical protein
MPASGSFALTRRALHHHSVKTLACKSILHLQELIVANKSLVMVRCRWLFLAKAHDRAARASPRVKNPYIPIYRRTQKSSDLNRSFNGISLAKIAF